MNLNGDHGAHHLNVQEHVEAVLPMKHVNVFVDLIIVKEEQENIFHVIHKIVLTMKSIFDNINVHNTIERHSKVSITTGLHTQKAQIHVN
jgi:hypothetical protein